MASSATAGCPALDVGYRVLSNNRGIGNNFGWLLTAAALTLACNAPCVYTYWPRQAVHRVDHADMRRLVAFPRVLHWLDSSADAPLGRSDEYRALANTTIEIPFHPRPYVNDYVPEPAWQMVEGWRARGRPAARACLTRVNFLRAYRAVQSELRPVAGSALARCLPPRRSFIALHVRRGNKAANARRDAASVLDANRTWRALGAVRRAHPALAWVVLTDASDAGRSAIESRLVSDVRARLLAWPACGDGGRPAGTLGALRDFFAINAAAGAVAIAPASRNRGLAESSFATVAALAGDVPLLTPAPFAEGGLMATYETRGNRGRPMRGVFFLDDLRRFEAAIGDATVRHRAARGGAPPESLGQGRAFQQEGPRPSMP